MYAEACNECTEVISASLRLKYTAPFEEIFQRSRAVGNSMFYLTGSRFEPQTSRSREEHVKQTLRLGITLTAQLKQKTIKSSLYSLYQPKHFTSLSGCFRVITPGQHGFKQKMSRWWTFGDIVSV